MLFLEQLKQIPDRSDNPKKYPLWLLMIINPLSISSILAQAKDFRCKIGRMAKRAINNQFLITRFSIKRDFFLFLKTEFFTGLQR